MAKDEFAPFAGVVCERLRRLRDKSARFRRQRDKMFKARDKADAELNETASNETTKRTRLLSDYGEACRRIKDLDSKIRDCDKGIDETIEYADQGELFPDPNTFVPPTDPKDEGGEAGDDAEEQ